MSPIAYNQRQVEITATQHSQVIRFSLTISVNYFAWRSFFVKKTSADVAPTYPGVPRT